MADKKLEIVISAIDKATAPIKNIGKSFDSFTEGLKKHREGFMALGIGAGIATAGIVAGVKSSTDAFAEFEATMSGVKAVLGPTTEEFSALNKKARELGKTTTYTAKQAADATEMLAKNGLTSKQILEGALDATISLAASTGAQLDKAADISSSAMLIFGKEAKDLGQVINSITGTTNVSKFGIEDYANALAQGGGVAKTVGVNFKDFNTSIAAISSLFNSGEDAGTSFKTFLLRLVPASGEVYGEMKKLGLITKDGANQFFDATGKMKSMSEISEILKQATKGLSDEQKNATLNTIFGTDAMRAASGIAETGAQKFNEMQKAIENTSATENARIRMENLKGASERFNGAINELQLTIGEALNPILVSLYDNLGPIITKFSDFIAQNPVLSKNIIIVTGAILGLTTALVALGLIIGPIGTALGAIGAVFGLITAPVLAVIAVIVALGVAMYEVWKNWDSIKPKLIAVWEGIKSSLEAVWGGLKKAWEFVWNGIKMVLDGILTAIGLSIGLAWQLITGDFEGFFKNISALWSLFWNGLKAVMSAIWEGIKTVVSSAWDGLVAIFTLGIETLTGWFSADGREKIYSTFTGMFSGLGEFVSGVFDGIVGGIKKAINFAISLANSLIEKANSLPGINLPTIPTIGTQKTEGARALGGPVSANRSYLVGENGPEIFTPGASGKINNNPSSGSQNITINLGGVTVNGEADENRLVEKIKRALIRETQLYSNGIA